MHLFKKMVKKSDLNEDTIELDKKEVKKSNKKPSKKRKVKEVRSKIINKTKNSANKFKLEFRERLVLGITSALGFLIALTWREPFSEFVALLIKDLGLKEQLIYKFVSALVFTIIAVIILIFISRWNVKKDE